MDSQRFDELTRAMGSGMSRRTLIKRAVLGSIMGGIALQAHNTVLSADRSCEDAIPGFNIADPICSDPQPMRSIDELGTCRLRSQRRAPTTDNVCSVPLELVVDRGNSAATLLAPALGLVGVLTAIISQIVFATFGLRGRLLSILREPADGPGSVDFLPACYRHDCCFATCGSDFDSCNRSFKDDLYGICSRSYPDSERLIVQCTVVADGYYEGVSSEMGRQAFYDAQLDVCGCCDQDCVSSGGTTCNGQCIVCESGLLDETSCECITLSTCDEGLVECEGDCVDLNSDPNNCSECGVVCGEGETCAAGACVSAISGTLVIRVFDALSGAPVARGIYYLDYGQYGATNLYDGISFDQWSDASYPGDGEPDGVVRFEGIAPGPHQLYVMGFRASDHVDTVRYRDVEIVAGEITELMIDALPAGGAMVIEWVDGTGAAFPGNFPICVKAEPIGDTWSETWGGTLCTGTRSPNYWIPSDTRSMGPGEYDVYGSYVDSNGILRYTAHNIVAVVSGETTYVTIFVTNTCVPGNPCVQDSECCSDQGELCVEGICVAPSTAGSLVIRAVDNSSGVPVPYGSYVLYNANGIQLDYVYDGPWDGSTPIGATSADGVADGTVRLEGLSPGQHRVMVGPIAHTTVYVDTQRYHEVDVAAGVVTDLLLPLASPPGEIEVTWVDAVGNPPTALTSICISIEALGDTWSSNGPGESNVCPGSSSTENSITFGWLLGPGDYEIGATYIDSGGDLRALTPQIVGVQLGQTSHVTLVLPDGCEPGGMCSTDADCCAEQSEVCADGVCVAEAPAALVIEDGELCDEGLVQCDEVCVDTMTSAAHCGDCGIVCAPDQVCEGGTCIELTPTSTPTETTTLAPTEIVTECASDLTPCDDICSDSATDPFNCGGCGIACSPDQVCESGICTSPPKPPAGDATPVGIG